MRAGSCASSQNAAGHKAGRGRRLQPAAFAGALQRPEAGSRALLRRPAPELHRPLAEDCHTPRSSPGYTVQLLLCGMRFRVQEEDLSNLCVLVSSIVILSGLLARTSLATGAERPLRENGGTR